MTRATGAHRDGYSEEPEPDGRLERLGDQFVFYGKAYGWSYRTLLRYKRELLRQVAAVAFGTNALAMFGGTAAVIAFLNMMTGAEVMIEGYVNLGKIGVPVLTGFFSAYLNTRITTPLVTTVGLVATVGAGITAELGARRTSEEIDALEVMAVPPIPFLVTTRILAGLLAATPLYAVALIVSFGTSRLMAVVLYAQSGGAYDHYFRSFLHPGDVLTSYLQVLAMSVVIVSVHSYYGFHAKGGPAGVGTAVGRSVRLSLVLVLFVQFALTLLMYEPSALRISR
ncbi:MAG TPA: ABC transporter permease [Pseudonocardia sp.]|jgi:phospholipid/cholesterol/gamma-HCH transport system permease protein